MSDALKRIFIDSDGDACLEPKGSENNLVAIPAHDPDTGELLNRSAWLHMIKCYNESIDASTADLSVADAARVLLEARNEAKQVPVGARRTPEQVALIKFKETALRALAKEPSHD